MNTYQIGDNDQFMGGQAWEYYMQALVVKDCKELVNKINAAFFNEVL
jgi:trans-2-enoyl-CoA reductase